MVIKQGAPTTVLQKYMSSYGHTFKNSCMGWKVTDAMAAMSAQEIHDVAEVALTSFEEVKGPLEIRTAVMKSIGIHPKDLVGAAAYLETASDPIPYPSDQDLEDWVGWNPAIMDILRELKFEANETRVRTERMAVIMTAVMRKLKGLEDAEALCLKESNLQKESQRAKTEDVLSSKK